MEKIKASEMEGISLPDILILGTVEGLEGLREIFQDQGRDFDVYLASNEIGKTVEELSEQNQELFERIKRSQVYINDVYYIREDNSNLAWVLGASSLVETSLPSRADKPGIGVFQDIVQHLSKPSKQRQVKEFKGRDNIKLDIVVSADEIYVVRTGIETNFAKSAIR